MNLGESDVLAMASTPLLRGLTKDEAKMLMKNQGFQYDFDGNGDIVIDQWPEPGDTLAEKTKISLIMSETNFIADSASTREGYAKIPSLRGLHMRKAMHTLTDLGFNAEMIGSGTIYAQYPKAGEWMRKGRTVTIRGKAKSMERLSGSEVGNED